MPQSIDELYPNHIGSQRRDKIKEDYGISGPDFILPCEVDPRSGRLITSQRKIAKHVLNERNYASVVRTYADRMKRDGYDNDDAGPLQLVATDSSCATWLCIGGGNRITMLCLASDEEPDNAQIKSFVAKGGFRAIYYRSDIPDSIIIWLVEDLNVKNTLGASNTLLQKITSTPSYLQKWDANNDARGRIASGATGYADSQWEFIKEQTPLYDSEIQWKKVQQLYNTLSNNASPDGKTLLQSFSTYFNDHADIFKLQSTEKSRNLVKYLTDLCAKILPARACEGKGKSIKYPSLCLEALKLSLESTDGSPTVVWV